MADPLFDRFLPERLASQGVAVDLTLKLGQLARIAEIIADDLAGYEAEFDLEGWRDLPVAIRLSFGWADQRESVVMSKGEVETSVPAICQRCLKPFALPLWASLDLLYAKANDDVEGDGGIEVWELEDDLLRPLDVVEEALILAIPFSPTHQEARDCEPLAGTGPEGEAEMQSPFAGLREQLQDKN
jgi:uncharacterized metal-binding protein YceD (DUF177 family)